jgi:hypothetical protein
MNNGDVYITYMDALQHLSVIRASIHELLTAVEGDDRQTLCAAVTAVSDNAYGLQDILAEGESMLDDHLAEMD